MSRTTLPSSQAGKNFVQISPNLKFYEFAYYSKPITYAICLDELGSEKVHKFLGREPSGRVFNEIVLDYNGMFHFIIMFMEVATDLVNYSRQAAQPDGQQRCHHVNRAPPLRG